MDTAVAERRRKLALLQHERVMEEAEFIAQLTRQARARAVATPVQPRPTAFATNVRKRIDLHLNVSDDFETV